MSRRGLHEWSAYSAWAGATGPITGPLRIDGLVGNAPTWRVDAGDCPIFDGLVAEWGPPGMLVGPGRELLTGEVVPS